MTGSSDKAALLDALRAALEGTVKRLRAGQDDASAGMRVDGTHRPTNRGERGAVTSAGYLAQGLEARLDEVNSALELLERLDPGPRSRAVTGAWVTVERADGEAVQYFLFPGAPGLTLGEVTVVSPEAPVGQALWGREADDEVRLPGGEAVVLEVR
ncbi:MAG: GreA/GreB family elongation factor [Myxococcales bacterium]|nr:GreA/GreB family elongation factor [Myxococcales bacterium]MCA9572794.1 GreA/GreB family elongation factor [Myxococcales bacterium]MCB9672609.1 GreA/GreB family elongation factor [Alphaproteobacteria bacterium]